jgi:hypothetical protein
LGDFCELLLAAAMGYHVHTGPCSEINHSLNDLGGRFRQNSVIRFNQEDLLMTTEKRFVWGCKGIAEAIGRSEKATFHALQDGKIPGAKKIAGRWALDLQLFAAAFQSEAA